MGSINENGDQSIEVIDFSEFLARHIEEEDFLVAKIDIEGVEHELLPKLVADGTIFLIDELFVECHSNDYTNARPNKTRRDCIALIQAMRDIGVYAHEW
jgi:hypothetical protein